MLVVSWNEARSCVAIKVNSCVGRKVFIFIYIDQFYWTQTDGFSRKLFRILWQLRATEVEYFQRTNHLNSDSQFRHFTTLCDVLRLHSVAYVRMIAKYSYESGRINIMSYFKGVFYSGIWLMTAGYKAGVLTITQRCCVPTFRYRIPLHVPWREGR